MQPRGRVNDWLGDWMIFQVALLRRRESVKKLLLRVHHFLKRKSGWSAETLGRRTTCHIMLCDLELALWLLLGTDPYSLLPVL